MKWRDVLGHTDQVEMFRRSIHRGRLSHSYLFAGPAGIGKKLFARVLAQCLLCEEFADAALQSCDQCPGCKQVAAQTHPDFFNVGRLEGKTELTIDVFLGPKERRGKEGLCYDLSLKPMAADRKVAIIDDADFMNEESANALLKTLEEPPPQSLLILIASNIDAILPTIRSRCQFVRFSPLKLADVSQLLIEQELVQDNDEAERIAAISEGSLMMAQQLLDPGLRQLREMLYDQLASEQYDSVALTADMLNGLDELASDSSEQRKIAGWIIRFCVEFYRQAVLRLSGNHGDIPIQQVDRYVSRFDSQNSDDLEIMMELFDRAALAERHLEWKMSAPLCCQGLFDGLGRLSRSMVTR